MLDSDKLRVKLREHEDRMKEILGKGDEVSDEEVTELEGLNAEISRAWKPASSLRWPSKLPRKPKPSKPATSNWTRRAGSFTKRYCRKSAWPTISPRRKRASPSRARQPKQAKPWA